MDALHAFIQGKSISSCCFGSLMPRFFAEGFVEAQRRWFALASRTTAVRRLQERNSWRTLDRGVDCLGSSLAQCLDIPKLEKTNGTRDVSRTSAPASS